MKQVTLSKADADKDYEGIPALADALDQDDLKQWAKTKDPSLIPHAIAAIRAAKSW